MMRKLKITLLAVLALAAIAVRAQDSVLQAVSVNLTLFTQGGPVVNSAAGTTNYTVGHQSFSTKDLIAAVTGSNFVNGQLLVRVTPTPIISTNIVAVSSTNLVLTNLGDVSSNALILGASSNFIGATNVTFGTNRVTIGGTNVTLGTNTATAGGTTLTIGTNTTMSTTVLTNTNGYVIGTNYAFTINALTVVTNIVTANGSWCIYNSKTHAGPTAISSNVYFDIHTDLIYGDTNGVPALIAGESLRANNRITSGVSDAIRSLVLSNATARLRLSGYSKGHLTAVNINTNARSAAEYVYSQDFIWNAFGSGVLTNVLPVVAEGTVTETFYKAGSALPSTSTNGNTGTNNNSGDDGDGGNSGPPPPPPPP